MNPFTAYDFALGVVSVIGLAYLLVAEAGHPEYRRATILTTFGVFALVASEPLTQPISDTIFHLNHALWMGVIAVGIYAMVSTAESDDWARFISTDPSVVRPPEEWMTPLDDHILELFYESDLVLTPAVIAYNLEYSRSEVNRHLSTLLDAGYVERVERGKYRLTLAGEAYLHGQPTDDDAEMANAPVD